MGKKNIRCNAVAPGLVLTPAAVNNLNEDVRNIFLGQCATPYLGEPEDVAATIAFLASNDARYITGQTIVVAGGLYRLLSALLSDDHPPLKKTYLPN